MKWSVLCVMGGQVNPWGYREVRVATLLHHGGCGPLWVQGSGKSTLYRHRFLDTHVHVSLDVLGTRAREAELLQACLDERRPFVIDNTNPTPADRAPLRRAGARAGFKVIGYLVEATRRGVRARGIPPARVAATARALQPPTPEEGFDELWHATAAPAAAGGSSRCSRRRRCSNEWRPRRLRRRSPPACRRTAPRRPRRRSPGPAPAAGADDRRRDVRLAQDPGERELGPSNARGVPRRRAPERACFPGVTRLVQTLRVKEGTTSGYRASRGRQSPS